MNQDQNKLNEQPMDSKSYDSYDEFYADIPLEGSLGILAMGASGLIPWRIKREKAGFTPDFIHPEPEEGEKPTDG